MGEGDGEAGGFDGEFGLAGEVEEGGPVVVDGGPAAEGEDDGGVGEGGDEGGGGGVGEEALLGSVCVCVYTTSSLSIHLLMDIWVASISWQL